MLTAHRLFRDEHLLLLSFYLLNFLMQRICVARILHGWENSARMFILSVCILVRKHFRLSQMNHRYMATRSTNLVNRQPIINVFFSLYSRTNFDSVVDIEHVFFWCRFQCWNNEKPFCLFCFTYCWFA